MGAINKNLFNAAAKKGVKLSLYKVLDGVQIEQKLVNVKSSLNPMSYARLHDIVLAALCEVAKVPETGAFGRFTDNNGATGFLFEMQHGSELQLAAIQWSTDHYVIKAAKQSGNTVCSYTFKEGKDDGILLVAAMLMMIFVSRANPSWFHQDSGFNSSVIQDMATTIGVVLNDIRSESIQANHSRFVNAVALIGETLYRAITTNDHDILKVSPLSSTGQVLKLVPSAIESGRYKPTEAPVMGKYHFFSGTAETIAQVQPVEAINREWNDVEQALIPKTEDWYVEPKEVNIICQLIQKSTSTNKPKRNFMLRGPSSTGKTSMARAIAAKLGMPYVAITCSADTESYAFLGQPMYGTDGSVRYIESDFIKAIKNGWLVEVQEPYVIAKQGVLTSLNGLMDDTAAITLPTGELIRRHPDAVVIFTTNVSYQGCKKPNQSVLRRMNNVFDINLPGDDEIIKRIESVTKFNDRKLVKKMVAFMHKVNNYLREQCVDDGVCGVAELIDWVQTVQCIGDVVESAESTIVSKASDDEEIQTYISTTLNSMFNPDEYTSPDGVVNATINM